MTPQEQLSTLSQLSQVERFAQHLNAWQSSPLTAKGIEILQINVGKRCNLQCRHCHVDAGPHRDEMMDQDTLERCLELARQPSITTIDITGGAPELHPQLDNFLERVAGFGKRVIVRTNLTVMATPKYARFLDLFAMYSVEVVASLPCYLEENTDAQQHNNRRTSLL